MRIVRRSGDQKHGIQKQRLKDMKIRNVQKEDLPSPIESTTFSIPLLLNLLGQGLHRTAVLRNHSFLKTQLKQGQEGCLCHFGPNKAKDKYHIRNNYIIRLN